MEAGSQRPNKREDVISALNAAIDTINLAEKASRIAPAKAVFGVVTILLALIRVCFLLLSHDQFHVHT